MPMRTWASLKYYRSHAPMQYLWPVLLLVGTCFACIVIVLLVSTRAQDDLQLARERQSMERALRATSDMVVRDLQDYAMWDEAVRYITRGFNAVWMRDNVVAYLGGTQDYSIVAVLDAGDRVIYTEAGDEARQAERFLASQPFQRAVERLRRLPPHGGPIVDGYARAGDDLYVYSVAQIVPLTDQVRIGAGPTHLLAIARRIDRSFLDRLESSQSVADLKVTLDQGISPARVVVRGFDGAPQAWMEWQPARPGAELRRRALPLFFAVGVLTLLATALLVRAGARTVEALRRSEAHSLALAHHDPLTGLPNRRSLMKHLDQAVAGPTPVTLVSMDLDGFKDVNDLYGHAAGDVILQEVQARLRTALPDVFLARAGGDEFFALFEECDAERIERQASAILAAFSHPFAVGDYQVSIGVSVGAAGNETAPLSAYELLRRADTAMYAAKAQGKGCFRVFEPAMDQGHHLRIAMEGDLRKAIDNGGIDVVYQPIFTADRRSISSIEALARWSHPTHGTVSPEVFIPIAEQGGMINALGEHVLRRACRDTATLAYRVSVNLSPAQFWDRNLLSCIESILTETRFPPERLQVEITENYLLRQPQAAAAILTRLRAAGVSIALDDFGAGFASIGYLRQLPLDRLKVDKQFIAPLGRDPKSVELLCAVVALAASLDLQVTAEGVETQEQAELARLAGCSDLQGWLLSRPLSAADLLALCRAEQEGERRGDKSA